MQRISYIPIPGSRSRWRSILPKSHKTPVRDARRENRNALHQRLWNGVPYCIPVPMKPAAPPSFKGNKQSLPSKTCAACGRPMTWRKRWARIWSQVRFCSEACRKGRALAGPS